MSDRPTSARLAKFLAGEYGMLAVLCILVILFSALTVREQPAEGTSAAQRLAGDIPADSSVFIVASANASDQKFITALSASLDPDQIAGAIAGSPPEIRAALESSEKPYDLIAAAPSIAKAPVFDRFVESGKTIVTPGARTVSVFLGIDNLRNLTSRVTVVAIIAIGMTMVIITAGIDLSVGSLVALSAVTTCWLTREFGGATGAGTIALFLCAIGGIIACSVAGGFTGWMVTGFCVPPFIATLAMMLMVRGISFMITDDQTINEVPDSFVWLGRGDTFGIPNSVILMVILYLIAHLVMSQTKLGRYIYAVGGNPEASRLSGVPVKRIKMIAYITCGALAGLGGVVQASQLKSGAANFGESYELEVIAAVVVGGTSLFGGRGKIFGTLIGAFIIAVIQNGMNLMGLKDKYQLVALGAVILIAVILERFRSGEWRSSIGG